MASRLSIKLSGFEEMLKNIEKAGGSIQNSVDSAMKSSAQIVQKELKTQMNKKGVDSGLINRMPSPSVEWEGNQCRAEVGYKKGSYNPKDLSDGYKAIFINYGTPRISPREFIKDAKKSASPQVKKKQKEVFEKITERLQK